MKDVAKTALICTTIAVGILTLGFLFYKFGGEPDVAGVKMCADLHADPETCFKFLSYQGFQQINETTSTTRTVVRP